MEITSYLCDKKKEHCCGCNACVQICPKNCIEMKMDMGFWYPQIDMERCISCGMCEKVCQYNCQEQLKTNKVLNTYAGWNKEKEVVENSTSGGIFPAIAKYVFEHQGVVFGTILDDALEVYVEEAHSLEEIKKMQGSKYVRSNTKNTYERVKSYLKENKMVLYTGTPCQIAGLKSFLRKDYSNLICVDIVCHGVPSELVFKEYKIHLEKAYHSKIEEFQFRHLAEGKMQSEYYIKFFDGQTLHEKLGENKYSKTYNSLIAHMPSCNQCPYTGKSRMGDITIGDFWGIDKINPTHVNANGTSLIVVNSLKGKNVIDNIKEEMQLYPHKIEEAIQYNPPLSHPNSRHPWRKGFIKEIEKKGFEDTYKKYIYIGNKVLLIYRVFRKLKNIIMEKTKNAK